MLNFIMRVLRTITCSSCPDKTPIPEPVLRRMITYGELYAELRKRFPEANIFLSDRQKWLCDISDIETFLELDQTNRQQYKSEGYDCDDFAYRLMGQLSVPKWASLAKAIVWTDVHALNGCFDTNMDWWFIEPQNNDIKDHLAKWQGKEVRLVII